jgi:hypothetical protein
MRLTKGWISVPSVPHPSAPCSTDQQRAPYFLAGILAWSGNTSCALLCYSSNAYLDLCMICQHANGDIVKEDLSLLFLGQTSQSAHSILHDPGF